MSITFSCDNCHSSFTVDSQLAGRSAKCRKCGQKMVIPAPEGAKRPVLASAGKMAGGSGAPGRREAGTATAGRKAGVAAAEGLRRSSTEAASRPIGWMDAVNSQIGLKPITMMAVKPVSQKEIDEWEDPRSQYKVVVPRDMRKKSAIVTKPAEFALAAYLEGIWSYRQFFNIFAILFRRINEMAYGISLIFLNVAIVGAIMSKHSIVVMGISMVVLLNLVQLGAGIANLIAMHFRGNIVQGLLFLFPPVTVYYLWKNSKRYKKAIGRIISPIIWLVVVTAAYTYIPWLNGTKEGMASLKEGFESIKKGVKKTVTEIEQKGSELKDQIPELDRTKLDELKKSTGNAVDELKSKAEKAIGGERSPDKSGTDKPGTERSTKPVPKKSP